VIHSQGDHVFNDWRVAFDGLGELVSQASGRPEIGARVAATFEPLRTAPRVNDARTFTVKCVGHPAGLDVNSIRFGWQKDQLLIELKSYALSRTLGEQMLGQDGMMRSQLARNFRALTQDSIDEDAATRFAAAHPGRRGELAALRSFYLQGAPMAFETLLAGPWEPPGF
jgi:hypothetical protein